MFLLVAAPGCEAILGIEDRSASTLDASTLVEDASSEADSSPVDAPAENETAVDGGCSQRPPAPPDADDPSDGNIAIVFALHDILYGEDDSWETMGFDLDQVNTREDGPSLSCAFTGTGSVPPVWWDHGCGVDNIIGGLIWTVIAETPNNTFDPHEGTTVARAGHGGMLLRISSYNGQPNDRSVTLEVFQTGGTDEPKWDGSDEWLVKRVGLLSEKPVTSEYGDPGAYVSDGVLVASIQYLFLPVSLSANSVGPLPLYTSLLTASLVFDEETRFYKLEDGLLGGKVKSKDLLQLIADSADQCDTSAYETLVCPYQDVAFEAEGEACNAFSLGVGFEAWQANLGDMVTPTTATTCEGIQGCH